MSFNSIGSDMECFAQDKDGQHIALCGKIGGTKEKPLQVFDLPLGFMVQEDNVAFEFNIPVCYNRKDFISAMEVMRHEVTNRLSKLDLFLSTEASVSFDNKELTHPNALIFGCEPDYNAWSMKENKKPHSKNANLRTSGGHIHVGTDNDMIRGIQQMDLHLGVPAVILDDKPSSIARRELYGKAGSMRPKPYGFEYRVLSNFWMFSNNLVNWVYTQTFQACSSDKIFSHKEKEDIQHCINTGNKDMAATLVKKYNLIMP